MSDLICRKSMMRCQTPGMCSPHGGCQDPVNAQLRAVNFDYQLGADAVKDEIARLKAECEGLRKDAERYRWLCERFGVTKLPCAVERILAGDIYVADGKSGVDCAIDAAMGQGGQSNG